MSINTNEWRREPDEQMLKAITQYENGMISEAKYRDECNEFKQRFEQILEEVK